MLLIGTICKIKNKDEEVLCVDKIRMSYSDVNITGYSFLHRNGILETVRIDNAIQVIKDLSAEQDIVNMFLKGKI